MTTPQVFVSQSSETTVEITGADPVVVEVSVPSVPSVVEVSVPGPQGATGPPGPERPLPEVIDGGTFN